MAFRCSGVNADEQFTHPESGTCRDLFECGEVPVTAQGHRARLIVATHQAATSPIGVIRDQRVYELFFTALPALGFTAADVVKLYLHRGGFETALADEDREQDSDRWSSYTPHGQEVWQILSQWVWNLRKATWRSSTLPLLHHYNRLGTSFPGGFVLLPGEQKREVHSHSQQS